MFTQPTIDQVVATAIRDWRKFNPGPDTNQQLAEHLLFHYQEKVRNRTHAAELIAAYDRQFGAR